MDTNYESQARTIILSSYNPNQQNSAENFFC